jgi:hypothetical protein
MPLDKYKYMKLAGAVLGCVGILAAKFHLTEGAMVALSGGTLFFLCGLIGSWVNDEVVADD